MPAMSEACLGATLAYGALDFDRLRMAFHTMGNGPPRPFSFLFETTKVPYHQGRVFHKMG